MTVAQALAFEGEIERTTDVKHAQDFIKKQNSVAEQDGGKVKRTDG